MKAPIQLRRPLGWIAVLAAGMLPAFVMRCDKAALNLQRGFYEGLGENLSEILLEQGFLTADGQTQE